MFRCSCVLEKYVLFDYANQTHTHINGVMPRFSSLFRFQLSCHFPGSPSLAPTASGLCLFMLKGRDACHWEETHGQEAGTACERSGSPQGIVGSREEARDLASGHWEPFPKRRLTRSIKSRRVSQAGKWESGFLGIQDSIYVNSPFVRSFIHSFRTCFLRLQWVESPFPQFPLTPKNTCISLFASLPPSPS